MVQLMLVLRFFSQFKSKQSLCNSARCHFIIVICHVNRKATACSFVIWDTELDLHFYLIMLIYVSGEINMWKEVEFL